MPLTRCHGIIFGADSTLGWTIVELEGGPPYGRWADVPVGEHAAALDFDGDGVGELFSPHANGLTVLHGDVAAGVDCARSYDLAPHERIAAGDFGGDGVPDLALSHDGAVTLLTRG